MNSEAHNTDKQQLDALTQTFFQAFTNKGNTPLRVDVLYSLFIPQALLIKSSEAAPQVYDLRGFIEPRKNLLLSGDLQEFSEEETSERTEIFGGIAQRFCLYQKSGVLHGVPFQGKGVKTIHFIKCAEGWRISSLLWEDEKAR
jgi:hypothetical protein